MVNAQLKKTFKINMTAIKYLDNLQKRVHRYEMRMTLLEYMALEEEAKEANVSVAAIIRSKLWPK